MSLVFIFALGADASLRLFGLREQPSSKSFLTGRAIGAGSNPSAPGKEIAAGPQSGATAVEILGADLRSSLSQTSLFDGLALHHVGDSPDSHCGGLFSRINNWSMEIKKSHPSSQKLGALLICAGDPVNWEAVKSRISLGMNLIYIGAPPRQDIEELGALLGVEQWRPAGDQSITLALGGEALSHGGFPPGLELNLNWSDGFPLAKVGGMARAKEKDEAGKPTLTDWGAVALRQQEKSRIVWTSLPITFWGRAQAIYGSHLDFVWMRLFQYLFGVPSAGLHNWPSGAPSVRTRFQRAQNRDSTIKPTGSEEGAQRQRLVSYVGPWDATQDTLKLTNDSNSIIAAHFLEQDIAAESDPQLKRKEMLRWRGRLAALSPTVQKVPLYVDPWQLLSANSLMIAAEAGFHFVAGGRIADRRTPVRLGFVPNSELAAGSQTWADAAAQSRDVMIWQMPSRGDEMPLADVMSLGGAFFENLTLGETSNAAEGVVDLRADELIDWLELRSGVQVQVERSKDRFVVNVTNSDIGTIRNAIITIDGGQWHTGVSPGEPMSLGPLSPGEVRTFTLVPKP
jgi:hypothetical protein